MKPLTILLFCCFINAASSWVKEMENRGLYEGDIKLTDEEIGSNGYASIIGGRWPNNIVPYDLSGMNSANHKYVYRAIEEYHKHTCLKFVKRTNEGAYLRFYPGGGCSSLVGYVRGRVNDVSLANGCLQLGTVLHEIGHSIGLYHEQSRPDRDDFITINWNNIQSSMRFNFDKHDRGTINSLGFPYDYDSMMHYGETAFGGGRVTIVTKDRSKQKVIGTIQGFSPIDIQQINAMYNCGGDRSTLPPTAPPQCVAGQDLDDRCQGWANTGYCTSTDPTYLAIMKQKCCKSCEGKPTLPPTAPPQCVAGQDLDDRCQGWANTGYCTSTDPTYLAIMKQKCCKSCEGRTTCNNFNARCDEWAKRGECIINPNYMLVNCPKSCSVCK